MEEENDYPRKTITKQKRNKNIKLYVSVTILTNLTIKQNIIGNRLNWQHSLTKANK